MCALRKSWLNLKQAIMKRSRDILQEIWGYSFRPLQEDIVDNVIYGHDTIAILPTGGGKSICFQVPGLAREGITVVISPLIALMQDQVQNLQKRGIKATLLSSGMSYREIDIELDNARFGKTKFLYTSPERIQSKLFIERFKLMNVGLIVVDEAHCISEWGHDFRPSYTKINELRQHHPETPIIALTASATPRVKEDIENQLELRSPKTIEGSVDRQNISYIVKPTLNKIKSVVDFSKEHPNASSIVYCQTRRSVKELAVQLRSQGIAAGIYHGGMKQDDRSLMLKEWMDERLKVIVATNAFGMGIDKPNVRYVLHYEFPDNLEAYYQEAGRAGRDNEAATATLFYNRLDLENHKLKLEQKYPPAELIKRTYDAICNFLSVATGAGENESYPFDIQDFSRKFNLKPIDVYASLKILSHNEVFAFDETTFFPTRVKFIIGQSTLYKFQVAHDELSLLITNLTRSYPGIFDRFIRIDEKELAKRTNSSIDDLRNKLRSLEKYGITEVNFQSSLPHLTLLQPRIAPGQLLLRPDAYHNRKERDQERLNAMIDYLTLPTCRAEQIASYFGSPTRKCGKCDVCLTALTEEYSPKEFEQLLLNELPATLHELESASQAQPERIMNALNRLISEEIVVFKDGRYFTT